MTYKQIYTTRKSIKLDGSNEYLTISSPGDTTADLNPDFDDAFSISAWINTTSPGTSHASIVTKYLAASPYTGYELQFRATGLLRFNLFGAVYSGSPPR